MARGRKTGSGKPPAAGGGRTGRKAAAKPRSGSGRASPGKLASPAAKRTGATGPAPEKELRSELRRLSRELDLARARITELEASAETDALLDIANRRGFERELRRALAYIGRYGATAALVMLDVDGLKPVNDAFGHAAGDAVLKAVVHIILHQIRSSDSVGRLGGDEFAILLWNISETDTAAKAAALEEAIDTLTFGFGGRLVQAGASIGVTMLDPRDTVAGALDRADQRMYVRKAERRGALRR